MCCTGQLRLFDLEDICRRVSNKNSLCAGTRFIVLLLKLLGDGFVGTPHLGLTLSAPSISLIERSMGAKSEKQCWGHAGDLHPLSSCCLVTFVTLGGSPPTSASFFTSVRQLRARSRSLATFLRSRSVPWMTSKPWLVFPSTASRS